MWTQPRHEVARIMNVNSQRQIVSGQGGEGVWTGQYVSDGPVTMTPIVAPGAGGNGPCWLGPRVLLDRFDVGLATCRPDGTDFIPILGGGPATSYGASEMGTSWAKFLADGVTGVQAAWGLSLPTMRWLNMSSALFVTPQSGDSIIAYGIGDDVPRWTQPAVAIDFYAVDADTVLWTDGARRIQVRNLPPPAQDGQAIHPFTFEAVGRRWLGLGRPGGFVIRPWDDATKGYIVVPESQYAYGPCAVPGDDPQHVIAFWSRNPGETAIMAQTVNLTAPMQDLTPMQPVPAFTHNIAVGVVFPSR
jgi:hypothetical protein